MIRRDPFSWISRLVLALTEVAILTTVATAQGAEYEKPPVLEASELMPEDLLVGPFHRVDKKVENDGLFNHFIVKSDFGDFEASSEAMLRVRVQEVGAIAKLKELSRTDAFADALKAAGKRPVDAVEKLVDEPVETVKALPKGVSKKVKGLYYKARKTTHDIKEAKDDLTDKDSESDEASATGDSSGEDEDESLTESTKEVAKKYIGYNSAKRGLAQRLRVDPYSDNQVLQAELTRLAQAAFVGGLAFKFTVPAIDALGYAEDVTELVWQLPPEELERLNDKALKEMGVSSTTRFELFDNSSFSTTLTTLLTESLKVLDGVPGRNEFVQLAMTAEDRSRARFFAFSAHVLASYHRSQEPVKELRLVGNENLGQLLVAATAAGKVVVAAPVDYLIFQEGMEGNGPLSSESDKELWITGRISARAREELERQGFTVHTKALETLRPADQG